MVTRNEQEMARLLGGGGPAGVKQNDPIRLRQGIIAGIGMGNVDVLFASEDENVTLFPTGGIPFLRSYRPVIGHTVWVWKNGPDMVVLGPVQARAANASEDWHYVGQEEYDEPPFLNSWANYDTVFEQAAFYMDPDGFVFLKGLIKFPTASGAANVQIFQMPDAYCPEYTVRHPVAVSAGGFGSGVYLLEITPAGVVRFVQAPNGTAIGTYASLSGVSYMAKGAVDYDRIHEWTPFRYTHHAWSWDADIENHTPPGVHVRWDGLVQTRGRYEAGTGNIIAGIPEDACRTRWDKLFATAAFEAGTFNLVPIRVDARVQQMIMVRVGTALNEEINLEGMTWMSNVPESYWTDLDLQNDWENYSVAADPQGIWGPAGFFKDGYGHVHLRGLIANGIATQDTVLGWLPPDCCPEKREVFPAMAGGELSSRIDVRPDGAILQAEASLTDTDYLSLDNVHFRANPDYTL